MVEIILLQVKQQIKVHGNQGSTAGNVVNQNSNNSQGTTNVGSTTVNNTQTGAANSTVTTDDIQETEIVESSEEQIQ